MDLIVRTAHGAADVSVDLHDPAVSLRDVVSVVSGQAAPGVISVDGRLVDGSDTLDACGVLNGSIIDTMITTTVQHPRDHAGALTVLGQLTGPGAGRRTALTAGHYRLGPGRREQADELDRAEVDGALFEIDVGTQQVNASSAERAAVAASLSGRPLGAPSEWRDETLIAGARLFRLYDVDRTVPHPPRGATGGLLVHNRAPGVDDNESTVIDGLDDARGRSGRLWRRRLPHQPFTIGLGLHVHHDAEGAEEFAAVGVDLTDEPILSVLGHPDDRMAMARSIVLDIATRYGPADVDIVVATTPRELGAWDWAKWLPHVRSGNDIDMLTNDLEMAAFTDRVLDRATVLVITADQFWSGVTSPLRPLLFEQRHNLYSVVLTERHDSAPATTQNVLELDESDPGAGHLIRMMRNGASIDLVVPLIDVETAAEVARHLAPLVDPERQAGAERSPQSVVTLDDMIDAAGAATRWDTRLGAPGHPVNMALGVVGDVTVGVDLDIDRGVIISGSTIDEAADLAVVLTMSIASTWSPTEAAILVIDHGSTHRDDPLAQLPHHAGTFMDRDTTAIDRFLARLQREVSGTAASTRRVVVVVVGLAETELAAPGLIDGLTSLATDSVGFHLIIATARPLATVDPAVREVCSTEVVVDRYGGRRRATRHDRVHHIQTPFTPYDERPSTSSAISVRPLVFGRQQTPLERRLERAQVESDHSRNTAFGDATQVLRELALRRHIAPLHPLLPIPLPQHVLASELWAQHHGDGVPLGLVEDMTGAPPVPYWWQPGPHGSRLVFGSPRSGLRDVNDLLLTGLARRFATDDLAVHVIDHHDRRRVAAAADDHVVRVASPDHADDAENLLSDVAAQVAERCAQPGYRWRESSATLVLVRELDRLGTDALAIVIDLLHSGADVGVNVVAFAARPDGLGDALTAGADIVVGAMSDPNDYTTLGVPRSATVERHPGRAQLLDGRLVQLAELPVLGPAAEARR